MYCPYCDIQYEEQQDGGQAICPKCGAADGQVRITELTAQIVYSPIYEVM